MILIYCLVIFSLFSADASKAPEFKAESMNFTNPERVEDFVFKGDTKTKSKNPKLQIANGLQATDDMFPYAAELSINTATSGLKCTASLIQLNWLVAARHCIPPGVTSVLASFGSADRQSTSRVKIYVDSGVWPADGGTYPNGQYPDIVLLHLTQTPPLGSTINVVRIPNMAQENFGYVGYEITAAGWGGNAAGVFPRFLQYTKFKIVSPSTFSFGPYFLTSQPLSGSTSTLVGGDSGGPAVIEESDGTETLVGVNAVTTGTSGYWQGSTRVTSFLRFIKQYTGVVYDSDTLTPVGTSSACLKPGQTLKSNSGCFTMYFQGDGNVVIYSKTFSVIWASNTFGRTATDFCMQGDGNLVLYNGFSAVWSSGTFGNNGAYVVLQNDANLVIYRGGTAPSPQNAIWSTGGLSSFPSQC